MTQTGIIRTAMLVAVTAALLGCSSGANFPERSSLRHPAQDPRLLVEPGSAAEPPEKTDPGSLTVPPQRLRQAVPRRRTPLRAAILHRQPSPARIRDSGKDEIETPAARQQRWKAVPADHKPTPEVNSPEWKREQEQSEKKDQELDRKIRSICRQC